MGAAMKDTNLMECVMERVNLLTSKEVITQVFGRKIICMVSVAYIIQTKNLHTKETGLSINFMEMGKFITMNRLRLRVILTIQILNKWVKNGCLMMEH